MKKTFIIFVPFLFFLGLSGLADAQNVGIGIANPAKGKLEVYGAIGTTSAIFGGDGAGISLQRNYPSIGFNQYYSATGARVLAPGTAFVQYLDMPSGSMCIDSYSAATQPNALAQSQLRRFTIRQNGNVSIYNYDQNASLFVGPNTLGITVARFRGTQHHSVFCDRLVGQTTQHTYINAGKTGSHVFINDQSGGDLIIGGGTTRVGINSQDPAGVLEIKQVGGKGVVLVAPNYSFHNWEFTVNHETNETQSDLWVYYDNQYRGNFFSVDGLYYPASDRQVKNNIEPVPSVLSRVRAMRPVEFEMKHHNNGKIRSIGFIAQEVKPLFPELIQVVENEHGYKDIKDLHTMNYDGLGPVAIKAIQEQQEKIKLLQERNSVLRQKIEAAEKALADK